MDTLFGALILILICFICTAQVMILTFSARSEYHEFIEELEERFNYILATSIELTFYEGNISFSRSLSLGDYAIAVYSLETKEERSLTHIISYAEPQIIEIVEFYLWKFHYWSLYINDPEDNSLELASKGNIAVKKADVFMCERKVIDLTGEQIQIKLIVSK